MKHELSNGLAVKVAPKGGVSVYGLGRYPVTLYESQWAQLIEVVPEVEAFIEEHYDDLSHKD